MQKQFKNIFDLPFLGRGFRPFFFLGAIYSVVNIIIWSGFYAGYVTPPSVLSDPILWHAHEIIYGFTMAIVAGFLLTAVANWTGGAPARQMHLAGLCLLWILGRVVMNVDLGLPINVIIFIEGLFVPALAISLSIPLLKSWNKRNFIFLLLLTILFICDIGALVAENRMFLYAAVMVIIAMISLIGGRIIPAFTVAALRRRDELAFQTPQMKMDILALASIIFIIGTLSIWGTQSIILGVLALVSAVLHTLRMRHYHTSKIFNDPMVWILHAGYGWVIVGLLLMSLAGFNILTFSTALHALTVGAIGSMTLGMMCRVTLGHTGRNLIATRMTTISFILMQLAAIIRVVGTIVAPNQMVTWIVVSGVLWSLCFSVYALSYTSMLWKARPDGRAA